MTQLTVGICEDDDELRGILRDALTREGWRVVPVSTGGDAVRAFAREAVDVVVLDIGLPDADGRDVCQALRARGMAAPVLFLTARDAVTDVVAGFGAGGDDYLTKPFALAELQVRVQALARRAAASAPSARADGLVLDPAQHAIAGRDGPVALTPTEYRILAALAARPGEVVRRATSIAAAWPEGAIVHDNTFDAYVNRLRRKLDHAGLGVRIETVRGIGHRLR